MKNNSLKQYNTFGIDVIAKEIVSIGNVDDAKTTFKNLANRNENYLILGGGSNVLFTDDFDGTVVINQIFGIEILNETENSSVLKVGAGENWHSFVEYTIEHNLGGIENLSLIPGCVGASPMQNIGAYGVEVKDVITNVYTINLETFEEVIFSNNECDFGYRSSIFKTTHKNKYLITHVEFKLSKSHEFKIEYGAIKTELEKKQISESRINIKSISEAVISIRKSKLPNPEEIGNAGSFFKNPIVSETEFESLQTKFPEIPFYKVENGIKLAAGWLIEKAGWKGYKNGDIGVHKKQALVLVNYGKANGEDIFQLSEEIIQDIYETFKVTLEREVNIL